MSAKKRQLSKRATSSKKVRVPKSSFVTIRKNELRIKYSNSHDLLDKLHRATQSVSRLHTHELLAYKTGASFTGNNLSHLSTSDIADVLGPENAYAIVTQCAGETDLTTKVGDLTGSDPVVFQRCVQQKVLSAGYKPGNIPASSSTTLWDVVQAIQGCSS
jgi:hypothetical protein